MAQSRTPRIGTIYSRCKALLEKKGMQEQNKPLWYDIYEAFPPKYEPDMTRWTAQEAFKGSNYVWKCDVWSLGVVFWECLTLGASPFVDIPTKELPMRVMRGMRLHQPPYVSEELFELLLECWQIDLDERPSFEEIVHFLTGIVQGGFGEFFNFNLYSGFVYEPYSNDLELVA